MCPVPCQSESFQLLNRISTCHRPLTPNPPQAEPHKPQVTPKAQQALILSLRWSFRYISILRLLVRCQNTPRPLNRFFYFSPSLFNFVLTGPFLFILRLPTNTIHGRQRSRGIGWIPPLIIPSGNVAIGSHGSMSVAPASFPSSSPFSSLLDHRDLKWMGSPLSFLLPRPPVHAHPSPFFSATYPGSASRMKRRSLITADIVFLRAKLMPFLLKNLVRAFLPSPDFHSSSPLPEYRLLPGPVMPPLQLRHFFFLHLTRFLSTSLPSILPKAFCYRITYNGHHSPALSDLFFSRVLGGKPWLNPFFGT